MTILDMATTPATVGPLLLTARILVLAGAILLPTGVLLGYYLSGRATPMRAAVDVLVAAPLVFPPIATGFLLLLLIGRTGPIGSILPFDMVFAFPGLVLASVVSGLPLVVKPVEAALRERTREVAKATDHYVHEHPWKAIGVAAGIGLLVGMLIGRR